MQQKHNIALAKPSCQNPFRLQTESQPITMTSSEQEQPPKENDGAGTPGKQGRDGHEAAQTSPPRKEHSYLLDIEAFRIRLPATAPLIGIDPGTTTLGLALSDRTRLIASGLETIRRTKFKADSQRLLAHIGDHNVCGLVIGFPINLDGSEGPRAQATRALARNLARMTPLPILLWDERLTTAEAERMLIAADTTRSRRAEVIDKLAATIILQNALDRMRNSSL